MEKKERETEIKTFVYLRYFSKGNCALLAI